MRLYTYEGRAPNFGDDLNAWLFPRLLPGCFGAEDGALFLGIGSILFDTHPPGMRKIVFGSGDGGYTRTPVLDASWDVRFVRGPATAARLGLPASAGIGDSAILLASLGLRRAPLPGRTVYMPHVDSACDGAWQKAAEAAGLRYVDPRQGVEAVLSELLTAEVVVTEAMHGAIVADALRVPWVAMRPLFRVHWAKWADWGAALDIAPRLRALPPSNALEALLLAAEGRRETMRALRWRLRRRTGLGAGLLRGGAVKALGEAARAAPQLSGDRALERAVARMLEHVGRIRREELGGPCRSPQTPRH
jgi:succinoglycan biosynthesis protein ExoV